MASTDECRLLTIPPELRNMIWNLALAEEKSIGVHFDFSTDDQPRVILRNTHDDQPRVILRNNHGARFGLLLVNHHTRQESLSIFYAVNTFRSDERGVVRFFLHGLSTQNVLGCLSSFILYPAEGRSLMAKKFPDYDRTHSGLERITRTILDRFAPRGMAPDVLKMPIRFRKPSSTTNRVRWVAVAELEKYELTNDGWSFYFLEKASSTS